MGMTADIDFDEMAKAEVSEETVVTTAEVENKSEIMLGAVVLDATDEKKEEK